MLIALGGYAVLAVVLGTVVALALPHSFHRRTEPFLRGPSWLDGWYQFDAAWYHSIAVSGYSYTPGRQSSIAYFPTYPMLMRVVGLALGDDQLAGTVVTVVAAAAAVALFAVWTAQRLPRSSATTAVLLLLVYPYSLFLYGAVYADSVFLLTAVAAFVLLEHRHYWLAGVVGALATAGRPVGVAVAIGLTVRMLEIVAEARDQPDAGQSVPTATVPTAGHRPLRELVRAVRQVRWREAGVLVSGLGLVGWCVFLWVRFGNPLLFVAAEASPGWDQGSGPRTWFKVAFGGQLLHGRTDVALTLAAQALACLVAVLLLRRVLRRFGWGYLAFSAVVIAIPIIGTKDFMGTGRYLLAAFPVLAAAGDLLATNRYAAWLRPLVLLLCLAGLVLATSLYARSYEVS